MGLPGLSPTAPKAFRLGPRISLKERSAAKTHIPHQDTLPEGAGDGFSNCFLPLHTLHLVPSSSVKKLLSRSTPSEQEHPF